MLNTPIIGSNVSNTLIIAAPMIAGITGAMIPEIVSISIVKIFFFSFDFAGTSFTSLEKFPSLFNSLKTFPTSFPIMI